jgi:hypothetical protein
MPFNWNAKMIVDDRGKVVSSFDATGTITTATFEDGTKRVYWTDTGDCWQAGHKNIGKDQYLTVVDQAVTDEALVAAYREADAKASELGNELIARGFTIIDDEGDEVYRLLGLGRIFKRVERDY